MTHYLNSVNQLFCELCRRLTVFQRDLVVMR